MTKQEAITAMKSGHKVTHKCFLPDEWITMINNQTIKTEEGYEISIDQFWYYRNSPNYETGWEYWSNI